MITFVTAVKYASSLLSAYNNMTFLFNTAWRYGETKTPVFPISLFYVKDMHEIQDAEVSSKPLLFYNGANAVDGNNSVEVNSVMNVVSDNIVMKPKEYTLDVIVPATINDYLNMTNYRFDVSTLSAVLGKATDSILDLPAQAIISIGNAVGKAPLSAISPYTKVINNAISTITSVAGTSIQLIRNLLSLMTSVNFGNTDSFSDVDILDTAFKIPMSRSYATSSDYNKEAFVQMCESRSILKMKTWKGWSYKYVAVVNYDIHKVGTENGVYQASLKLTELPIMTMLSDRSKGYADTAWHNPVIYATANAIKTFVDESEVR